MALYVLLPIFNDALTILTGKFHFAGCYTWPQIMSGPNDGALFTSTNLHDASESLCRVARGEGEITMKELTLILVLVFTLCITPGCKKIQGSAEDKSPSPAAQAAAADPKRAVTEASRKLIAANTLSAKVVGVGQVVNITKDVQYVAPDRYHIVFDDEHGARTEMTSIGNETWIRSGDSWDKLEVDESPTSTFRNNFTDEVVAGITDVKFKGEEMLDNIPVLVFSYELVTKVGSFHVTHTIWVDANSGIPVKGLAEYHDTTQQSLTTIFDTKTPVTIERPVK